MLMMIRQDLVNETGYKAGEHTEKQREFQRDESQDTHITLALGSRTA